MVWKGEANDPTVLSTSHMEALRTSGGGVRRSFVQVIKPTPSLWAKGARCCYGMKGDVIMQQRVE